MAQKWVKAHMKQFWRFPWTQSSVSLILLGWSWSLHIVSYQVMLKAQYLKAHLSYKAHLAQSSIYEGSPCPEAVGFRQIAQLLVRSEDHKGQDHLKTSKSRLNNCRNALQLPGRQTTCQSRRPRSRPWNAPPPRPCPQGHQLQRSQDPPVTLSCTSYIIITKVIHIKYKNVPTCQVWAVMAARAMGKV